MIFCFHRRLPKGKHPNNYKQYLTCKSTALVSGLGIWVFFSSHDSSYLKNCRSTAFCFAGALNYFISFYLFTAYEDVTQLVKDNTT